MDNVKVVYKKTPVKPEDINRLQPQARELEEAVLGALMLEKDAFSKVSEILKPEHFYEVERDQQNGKSGQRCLLRQDPAQELRPY